MFHLIASAVAEETEVTAEAVSTQPSWFGTVFAKLADVAPIVWVIIGLLVIAGIILYAMGKSRTTWSVRMMANASLTIALSFVLSFIRLYKMPQGGSITLASMLPIFLFAYAYGVTPGMTVGLLYGFLQWIQDGFYMVHPVEAALDYFLAFTVLGLAGISKKLPEQYGLPVGCIIGSFFRAVCAVISGCVFFGMNAPEGQPVILYSLSYNALYLIPETLICVVLSAIPQIRLLARKLAKS